MRTTTRPNSTRRPLKADVSVIREAECGEGDLLGNGQVLVEGRTDDFLTCFVIMQTKGLGTSKLVALRG